MTLFEQIKTRLHTAIKQRDVATRQTLKTLVGELETRAKRDGEDVSDAVVVKLINKFIDGNNDVLKHRDKPELVAENELLSNFLPKLMSEDEIRHAVAASGGGNIGAVMGYLKRHHDGRFDGGLASKLAREHLA